MRLELKLNFSGNVWPISQRSEIQLSTTKVTQSWRVLWWGHLPRSSSILSAFCLKQFRNLKKVWTIGKRTDGLIDKSNIKHRNTLCCLDQHTCRLWKSLDCETAQVYGYAPVIRLKMAISVRHAHIHADKTDTCISRLVRFLATGIILKRNSWAKTYEKRSAFYQLIFWQYWYVLIKGKFWWLVFSSHHPMHQVTTSKPSCPKKI